MKQLMTLLLFALAMNLHGFAVGTASDPDLKVKRTIQKVLSYPGHLDDIDQHEIVLVEFVVESCGFLRILNCNGSNPALCDWVCEKISELEFDRKTALGQTMAMKISFRKEDLNN